MPAPLPSKEQVAEFIATSPAKIGKREIAKAFGISGSDRIWLKDLLHELEEEGTLQRRGKRVAKAGGLPPVFVADVKARDRDGDLLAEPAEWDGEGARPRIVVTLPRKPKRGEPVPGVGDRVLLRMHRPDGPDAAPSGRVIKMLPKEKSQVLGIYRALPNGAGGRLVPVEKRSQGRELVIEPGDENGAKDGDLVAAEVNKRGNRFGLPNARVSELLGSIKSEKAVSLIAIHAHGIPQEFSRETLADAEAAKPASLDGREDWRALPLVTIDPPDAKDHDDAVHAVPDDDPGNPGGFVVTVAIADVAAYVHPGSSMDREALERGNSVYFPDRVVPMLPERISNDLCSLRPREDRPALAVRMVLGRDGRKKRHSFHRVMIRSAAKLSYQQAQAAIDGRPDEVSGPLLDGVLQPLWAAYRCASRARDARSPLALDLPERKIVLRPDGTVDKVIVPQRLDAHRLIEEFMILANVAAAETLEKADTPLVYRVHDEPSLEKMRVLGEVLGSIGIKLPKQGALKPELFNGILTQVEGSEHQTFINEVVLRSQAQAEYAAENYGHFGLNLRRYAHFTSPIRRYADLIVHRALIRAFKWGPDGLPASTTVGELAQVGQQISAAERRAMAAERETIDRLIAHHMADKVGATFQGQISGATRAGLFVKLHETGADGFIPASQIGADYYRYEEGRHALVGDRTGETYRLGDEVTVTLVEAAPVAGALRFELVSGGRSRSGGARRGRKPGTAPEPRGGWDAPAGRGQRPAKAPAARAAKRSAGSTDQDEPAAGAVRPARGRVRVKGRHGAGEGSWTPLDE